MIKTFILFKSKNTVESQKNGTGESYRVYYYEDKWEVFESFFNCVTIQRCLLVIHWTWENEIYFSDFLPSLLSQPSNFISTTEIIHSKMSYTGVLLWCSGLRIQHYNCSGLGNCCGMGSILGSETSIYCGSSQKITYYITRVSEVLFAHL